jgi:hypothetical protein
VLDSQIAARFARGLFIAFRPQKPTPVHERPQSRPDMARDKGLEELIHDELQAIHGICEKAMFGGWAWLLDGNLLCGARAEGTSASHVKRQAPELMAPRPLPLLAWIGLGVIVACPLSRIATCLP